MKKYLLFIISFFLVCSCHRKEKKQWSAKDFFEQAFDVIEQRSIKKNEIDWKNLRSEVIDSISYFYSNEDVYRAIAYTVELIGDGHSTFLPPHTPSRLTVDSLPIPDIITEIIDDNIGLIKLTGFIANADNSRVYSRRIRESLYDLDRSTNIAGWIIDLRENIGGLRSMMPLGLAPMFQDSLIGFIMNNKGEYFSEYCSNEYYRVADMADRGPASSFRLLNKNKPIAVLISENTVSAGETLASSFKFQNNTKTFGTPTKGQTTALEMFEFASNARLLLATMYLCDRDKQAVYGSIQPDVECNSEKAKELAIKWIKTQDAQYL